MPNTIRLRRGSAAPSAVLFVEGEPAWDSTNKRLYIKAADGTMVLIGQGKQRRIDSSAYTTIYVGSGNVGITESDLGWTIIRTTYNATGTLLTTSSGSGAWSNRTNLTYS